MMGLLILFGIILVMPFLSKTVEDNLEFFLLFCSFVALWLSKSFSIPLLVQAITSPLLISAAVLLAGFLFNIWQRPFEKLIWTIGQKITVRFLLALTVSLLGLLSSIITAIIAAIVLVSIVDALRLDRRSQVQFVVLACFSIGLGAVLTPIGEPLSTIATNKLNEGFTYLFQILGLFVIPGVLLLGVLSAALVKPKPHPQKTSPQTRKEPPKELLVRSVKVYFFVMALTLLGASFETFIALTLLDLHPLILYWVNMISAVLDNATLAAAEISPTMDASTIRAILLGLLVSGGMLIPGNIPNIIVANQLAITSKEWARLGVPLGLLGMLLYFGVLLLTYP